MSKYLRLILVLLCVLFIAACEGNRAEELFKIAEFEELQNNTAHAEQLYKEILGKYPDSEYAVRAKERIVELNKK